MTTQASDPRSARPSRPEKDVPFFIDGERFTTRSAVLSVEEVLGLVAKSAAEWYVVERHGREQTEYRSGQQVPIKPGARFLTVSTGPTRPRVVSEVTSSVP